MGLRARKKKTKLLEEEKLRLIETEPRVINSDGDDEDFEIHHAEEEGEVWLISYADLMTLLVAFFALLLSFSKIDNGAFEKIKKEAAESFGGEYTVPHQEVVEGLKSKIKELGLKDKVNVEQTDKGVAITFLGSLFFESAHTDISKEGLAILDQVVLVIKEKAKDFQIVIEGHTDDQPIAQGVIKSNWGLSGLRAGSVAGEFEKVGISRKRLKIVGFGEIKPLYPNHDRSGRPLVKNQARNRRVVIQLIKQY